MRAAADAALDRLPVVAGVGRPRQHRVLGRHPAEPAAPAPARHVLLDAGRAQHAGVAELHQHRALGVVEPAPGQLHRAQFGRGTSVGSGHARQTTESQSGSGPTGASSKVWPDAASDSGPAYTCAGLGERALLVGPGRDVGQDQVPGPGPGRVLARLSAGQVQVGRQVRAVQKGGLAQQQVGVAGQVDQGVAGPGVGRVGQRPAAVLEAEAVRLDRMVHPRGGDLERADRPGARSQRVEGERLGHARARGPARRRLRPVGQGEPLRRPVGSVHRDRGLRAPGAVAAGDPVPAHVQAVVGVQVAQGDRVDVVQAGVPLQHAQRAVAQIEHEPEALRLQQVAGGRAFRAGEAARAPDDGQPHAQQDRGAGGRGQPPGESGQAPGKAGQAQSWPSSLPSASASVPS